MSKEGFIKERISKSSIGEIAMEIVNSSENERFSNYCQKVEDFYIEYEIEKLEIDSSVKDSLLRFIIFIVRKIVEEQMIIVDPEDFFCVVEKGDDFVIRLPILENSEITIVGSLFLDWFKQNCSSKEEIDLPDYYLTLIHEEGALGYDKKKIDATLDELFKNKIFIKQFQEYSEYQIESFRNCDRDD